MPVRIKKEAYMLEFPDSESLAGGILFLFRKSRYRRMESRLYKMPRSFRLIVKTADCRRLYLPMNEFCTRQSSSGCETAYTEEYGRLLTGEHAIETIGRAFSKGS